MVLYSLTLDSVSKIKDSNVILTLFLLSASLPIKQKGMEGV